MKAFSVSTHRLYYKFRRELDNAQEPEDALAALSRLFPILNVRSAGLLQLSSPAKLAVLSASPDNDRQFHNFWQAFGQLHRSGRDPISRVIRLAPHPIALSDLRRHQRLHARCADVQTLLARLAMDDIFAVPVVDPHLNRIAALYAGRDLILRPSCRHLLAQSAADTVASLAAIQAASKRAATPQHLSLTRRQMEIATWLVAGKSDWEIGEILSISPKTVNFHVENIKRKYGVRSRTQFIAAIVHDGGVDPGQM